MSFVCSSKPSPIDSLRQKFYSHCDCILTYTRQKSDYAFRIIGSRSIYKCLGFHRQQNHYETTGNSKGFDSANRIRAQQNNELSVTLK